MELKTQPGPWSRDKYGTVLDAAGKDVRFRSVSIACSGDGVAQAEANTDLIAAAPDLLAALHNLEVAANSVRYCYDHRPENFAMALTSMETDAEAAREAIAKATGAA